MSKGFAEYISELQYCWDIGCFVNTSLHFFVNNVTVNLDVFGTLMEYMILQLCEVQLDYNNINSLVNPQSHLVNISSSEFTCDGGHGTILCFSQGSSNSGLFLSYPKVHFQERCNNLKRIFTSLDIEPNSYDKNHSLLILP